MLDDHVTIEGALNNGGSPSIFNLYIRMNGHGNFRHRYKLDNYHIVCALTLAPMQDMLERVRGGNDQVESRITWP